MSSESVKFTIELSGTYHDKRPEFSISIDDIEYVRSSITGPTGERQTIEFDADLTEGPHCLDIRLLNKEPGDTVKSTNDPVNFTIVKDMLLNIEKIKFDNIDLDSLIWTESSVIPDRPVEFNGQTVTEVPSCVNIGWNGTYRIKFNSPLYIWLLEKM
jgi:hypothetical protein